MSTPKHRFFVPPDLISDDRIVFPTEEARHASKVLRLGIGNEVTVVDGAGGTYVAEIEVITGKGTIARILSKTMDVAEPDFYVHIGVGLLKQSSRWEMFLEKAVELGASRITPLVTQRMQKISFNQRRAEAIVIAALKQSGRSRLPILDPPTKFSKVIQETSSLSCRMICHEASSDAPRIQQLMNSRPDSIGILVGPEGGFTDEEITKALGAGWKDIWLGERRLRTETAAVAALSVVTQAL
jgi:16S rRNA (uracil1498-N3)-methyltransferase